MALITLEELKKQLELEGVSYGDFSDEQLQLLLDNVVSELMGYTNAPINPTNHKMIVRKFEDDFLELDFYPVGGITSLKIGSLDLSSDDYVLDDTLGILYLNSKLSGLLVCEYCCRLPESVVNTMVNPLLFDMIKYRLTTGFTGNGVMSSVKEGDVQVNYDTGSSLGNLIQGRIKDLKGLYSIRIKVL